MANGTLTRLAADLPDIWKSRVLGHVGSAAVKLIRMGGEGIPDESHADFEELLVVIDGEMQLVVDNQTFTLHAGDHYLVPRGATHRVPSGSYGTLLLVDSES